MLAEHHADWPPVARVDRRPCPYASSFAIDEIDVAFADGSELRLVLKDMRREAMTDSARRARPEFLYEPRREMHMYRRLLPQAPPGTAAWFGVMAPSALLLERVDGLELRLVGDFAKWKQAARWIARFHRTSALTPAADREPLLVYDEAFYWLWLERAQRFAAARPVARPLLDRLARVYGAIVNRLANLPRTVIHGEFYPCNILMATNAEGERVCPVDWEMAATGPGLIDLAALTTGWSAEQRQALIDAYQLDAPVPREWAIDLDCCRLHLAMRMLGWSDADAWAPPPQHAHDWLAEAEHLAERLHL